MSDTMNEARREKEIPKKLDELSRVVEEVAGAVEQLLADITPALSAPSEQVSTEPTRQEPSCGMAKDLDHSVARLETIRDLLQDAKRRVEV